MDKIIGMLGAAVIGLLLSINGYGVYNQIENRFVKENIILTILCVLIFEMLVKMVY